MSAYYNEHDPKTAAWLRKLIKARLIADGEVDERSIVDVEADDVRGFTQCHFFAGIGGWSYALRLAGWADDRECWTGSCPCQPFSIANVWRDDDTSGTKDARHLWPSWFRLIRDRRPAIVFGEQVESAIANGWLDDVCDDLEGIRYAVGAAGLPAPSVGAFHGRPRLWFGAADMDSVPVLRELSVLDSRDARPRLRLPGDRRMGEVRIEPVFSNAAVDAVADPTCEGPQGLARHDDDRDEPRWDATEAIRSLRDADLWGAVAGMVCRDGRSRPLPMADGIPEDLDDSVPDDRPVTAVEHRRAVIIKGFGNAIVPQVAAEFIRAWD